MSKNIKTGQIGRATGYSMSKQHERPTIYTEKTKCGAWIVQAEGELYRENGVVWTTDDVEQAKEVVRNLRRIAGHK